MIVGFSSKAWEDYKYWVQNDKQILNNLLRESQVFYDKKYIPF